MKSLESQRSSLFPSNASGAILFPFAESRQGQQCQSYPQPPTRAIRDYVRDSWEAAGKEQELGELDKAAGRGHCGHSKTEPSLLNN